MIAIVGGGISGLALAHQLAARDRPFVLLESSGRVGGVIRSGLVDGRLLEEGPQRARLSADFQALIDDLGLRDQLITAPPDLPLFIYARGRLRRVPFSLSALLRSDLLTWPARSRLLLEPFTHGPRTDETVAAFFTRKLGREVYQNLAGPLYGGLYASDPADMVMRLSLIHTLRDLNVRRSLVARLLRRGGGINPPLACSFRDGLETLPRALYARHAAHIRLNTPVHAIERRADAYEVITDRDRIPAEHVVITAPAPAAALMLSNVAPDAAARIATLRYNPLTVVHMHADTNLRGLGYQVSLAESLLTRGVTWNDSLFRREGVYTAFLGDARHRPGEREPVDRAAEIAVTEFRTAARFDASALSVEHVQMPAWDRSWAATEGLLLPHNLHIHASWHARPGIPGRLIQARRLAEIL